MKIEIFTDGACSSNPGKGGYGIIMRISEKNYENPMNMKFIFLQIVNMYPMR